MASELQTLIDLQELDQELNRLSQELERIPQDLARHDTELDELATQLTQAESAIEGMNKKRKKGELDLASLEDKQQKLQGQLFQVKTNEQYQAMLSEIGHLKKDSDRLEEEILVLLDEIEGARNALKDTQAVGEEKRSRIDRQKAVLKKKEEETRAEFERVSARRTDIAARLPEEVLANYERICKGRGGIAVVAIKSETCGGCNTKVRPQILAEIVKGEQLMHCEMCQRFVYLPSDSRVFVGGSESDDDLEVGMEGSG